MKESKPYPQDVDTVRATNISLTISELRKRDDKLSHGAADIIDMLLQRASLAELLVEGIQEEISNFRDPLRP